MTETALQDINGWSPQGPVTELSEEHAWSRLRSVSFGRLGVSMNGQPEIFPVDYYTDGTTILFRTAQGTKLSELSANSMVVFEVDARTDESAWSVTVKGTAHMLTDDEEIAAAESAPLPAWRPILRYFFVRITPTSVHGRAFQRHVRLVRLAR